MSLVLTQRPGNNIWVAACSPILYKLTRKDYTWATLITSAGNTSMTVTGTFTAGDSIWLQSDDGAYSGTGTVVSYIGTTLITTVPYVANNASGYVNNLTTRKNYYVATDVFKGSGAAITTVSIANTPTKTGTVTIDVQMVISSLLDAQFTQSLGAIVSDSTAFQSFYIQYTEMWTGSANSPTSDSANISYAAYASKQIGEDGFMTPYSTGLSFLTKFDRLLLSQGDYYALSWIDSGAVANMFLKKDWTLGTGVVYAKTFTRSLVAAAKQVYSYTQLLPVSALWPFGETLRPDRNVAAGTAWASDAVTVAAAGSSAAWCTPIFLPTAGAQTFSFNYSVTIAGSTLVTITLKFYDSTGTIMAGTQTLQNAVSPGTYTGTSTAASVPADCYYVGLAVANGGAANTTVTMNSFSLNIPSTIASVAFRAENISTATPYVETVIAGPLSGDIRRDWDQPVTLFWRNSVGGLSSWTFKHSQDKQYNLAKMKNKALTLFDTNLTPGQWEAAQEVNTVGEVYDVPVIELSTSLTRSQAKRGQQVYSVSQAGVLTGVISKNTQAKVKTRELSSNVTVNIDFPEYFQQR